MRRRPELLHPAWTLGLPLIAATAVVLCPAERRLYGVVASAMLFALMQWVLPKCRFRTDHYFSPVNVALALMLVWHLAPRTTMPSARSSTTCT